MSPTVLAFATPVELPETGATSGIRTRDLFRDREASTANCSMIALKLVPLPSAGALRAGRARSPVVPFAENLVEELGFEPRFSAFQKQRERPDFPIPRQKMLAVRESNPTACHRSEGIKPPILRVRITRCDSGARKLNLKIGRAHV